MALTGVIGEALAELVDAGDGVTWRNLGRSLNARVKRCGGEFWRGLREFPVVALQRPQYVDEAACQREWGLGVYQSFAAFPVVDDTSGAVAPDSMENTRHKLQL